MRLGYFLIACAACGGAQTPEPDRRSYTERMLDAERHEQRASEHERVASSTEGSFGNERYYCGGDPVAQDQSTSGGLRIATWQPCFDIEDEAVDRHRDAADHERQLARRDRRMAAAMIEAERTACAGVPDRERGHSAFAHRKSIESVTPVRDGDRLTGVRVVFKPVKGLTAAWLNRDIACHRARWVALGRDPKMSPMDPTLVEDAELQIQDVDGHVEVLVTTKRPEQAEVALARARGDLVDTTARR